MLRFSCIVTKFSLFFPALLLTACFDSFPGAESQFVFGTICTINLFDQGKPARYSRVFSRLRELEDILSANREGTDLDRVNKNAGFEPVKVRPELIEVLEKALEYADKSGGLFDPSIGPLVKLWGIGTDNARIPETEEILAALDLIDYREIEIDRKRGTVFLKRPGMALDLGAIAKGYAADETARLLAGEGVKSGIIDLGGNIFALGEKKGKPEKDGACWRIGVQDPVKERGNYIGVLTVKNKSVVTSGVYERFLEADGKHYHHIFSTAGGFPAENGLLSVTIAADASIDADALSTAAFALGWERGRDLIAGVSGADGIFVFDDLSMRLTEGFEKSFTLTAAEYRLTLSPSAQSQKPENCWEELRSPVPVPHRPVQGE
jgi:thiamine biosynthesis lipoprotein